MRLRLRLREICARAGVAALVLLLPGGADATVKSTDVQRIPGHYIVILKPSAGNVSRAAATAQARYGFRIRFTYTHALRGFAAALTDAQVQQLSAEPGVSAVVPDRRVQA